MKMGNLFRQKIAKFSKKNENFAKKLFCAIQCFSYNTYLGYRLKGEASKAVREGRCAGNCDCEQIQVELLIIVLWMSCSLKNFHPYFYRLSERSSFKMFELHF